MKMGQYNACIVLAHWFFVSTISIWLISVLNTPSTLARVYFRFFFFFQLRQRSIIINYSRIFRSRSSVKLTVVRFLCTPIWMDVVKLRQRNLQMGKKTTDSTPAPLAIRFFWFVLFYSNHFIHRLFTLFVCHWRAHVVHLWKWKHCGWFNAHVQSLWRICHKRISVDHNAYNILSYSRFMVHVSDLIKNNEQAQPNRSQTRNTLPRRPQHSNGMCAIRCSFVHILTFSHAWWIVQHKFLHINRLRRWPLFFSCRCPSHLICVGKIIISPSQWKLKNK